MCGGFYQSPYTQPGNPYMERMAQLQQAQQPAGGLIRVTGMDGARAYPMQPNSMAALFDSDRDVFYVKTTDAGGFPTLKAYTFAPVQEQAAQPAGDYVTRAEFNQLKEMIMGVQQSVQQPDASGK